MSNIATLLHISDLHFDDELTERGRRHWKRNLGVKSHSFGKVDALSAKLFALLGIGIVPNILLVTGDVTTDGSPGSLEVAREFLEESEIFRGNPGRLVTLGLNAKKRERIVVPGNHDRYVDSRLPYQSQNDGLEKVFAMPSRYPHVFCFRPPGRPSDATEPALLFFVFDSSAPLSRTQDKAPWVRIARGRIEDAECRWLVAQASTIRDSGSAPDLTGEKVPVDYDNAIRIAVLHHHPIK